MAATQAQAFTTEDYRRLPGDLSGCQLIDGEIFMAPAPNLYHQRVVRRLAFALQRHLEIHRGGELFLAPVDVYFDETNVFPPDLVFVADSGAARLKEDGIYGPPDLVIEVLSPGSCRHDLGEKKAVYASSGVLEYWVVDPGDQRVDIYAPTGLLSSFHAGDTLIPARVLPGFALLLDGIFSGG